MLSSYSSLPSQNSLQLNQIKTLISLSRSHLTRVSAAGSDRSAALGDRLRHLCFLAGAAGGGGLWAVGWDFSPNYAWRLGVTPKAEIALAAAELTAILSQSPGAGPDKDWTIRNYDRVVRLSDSLLGSLLREFFRGMGL
ncbi:putative serrate RNA effector molecule [Iris pallida]|uniref:Serrate RNA effector molecule n=1 Tax=Iris pallida TaxID=29817 RepID=A0AAX6HSU4_IRIPA|nr:putative serrate RNA effector molecule [Iris pallida]